MFDLIIKNGTIIDGTGEDKYSADIGIIGERIKKIGNLDNEESKNIIDAKGKIVSPGFIDPHSHADMTILFCPENEGYLFQGVTTFVGGNCGGSASPVGNMKTIGPWDIEVFSSEIQQKYYEAFPGEIETKKAVELYKKRNIDIDYRTFEEYCEKLEEKTFTTNYYPLVGHSNLRNAVMGFGANRKATNEEIEQMKTLLKKDLEVGARGLSTGLDYPPGAYSTEDEVLELEEVLKEYDGIYASHIRGRKLFTTGEGGYDIEGGLNEVFNISLKHGIKVHASHMNSDFDPDYVKSLFDKGIENGANFSFDVIANVTGGGNTYPRLMNLLKPWYLSAGSIDQFKKNLKDKDYVKFMKNDMSSSRWFYTNDKALPGVERAILIVECEEKSFENKNVAEIMKERDWDYQEALINIIKSDVFTKIKYGLPSSPKKVDQVKDMFNHERVMPSIDGMAVNLDTQWGDKIPMELLPHKNNYSTFINYLSNFAPERIEEAIRKGTGYVAERFGIKDRGILLEEKYADIIIIDLDNLDINENNKDPRSKPTGIDYVVINGEIIVDKKTYTGAKTGKVLKAIR